MSRDDFLPTRMSERNYTAMVVIGVGAIVFDVLMLGGSIALAVGLGLGIMAATVLIEFVFAAISD
jgi:hypothetical protein